ncbi:MAG: serine/threonine protein kinase [Lachnospiraceae bacterium]|nr:serine/threonine protein kinase [Lachnospiraceae bacterium]
MTIESQLALSYYEDIAEINAEHKIFLVQHRETKKIFIKKILNVFNLSVFQYLQANPIKNTPHIYEVMEDGDRLILIEEYISGSTLEELLNKQGSFSEAQVINYMIQLCTILEAFHNCNPAIIHRDIKPSNIILSPDGVIKLLDLNAAKYSDDTKEQDTKLLGTQGYAAPEQYGFGSSSVQTDIYSVGIMMNELLTGRLSRENIAAGKLASVIRKCIMMNPSDRYGTVAQLRNVLYTFHDTSPQDQVRQSWRSFLPPGFRTKNFLHMLIAVMGYIMVFYLGITLEMKNSSGARLQLERCVVTLMMLSIVLFSANYKNVQKSLPLCSSKNIIVRIIGVVIADCLIFVLWVILLMILESIFFTL